MPAVRHASLVSYRDTHMGSTVAYECDEGYLFSYVTHRSTIECTASGEWQDPGECVSK